MVYLVFDLDNTLANLKSIQLILWELETKGTTFQSTLDNIYNRLVTKVTYLEMMDPPLGILTPGVINLMKYVKEYKNAGLVKGVIIYSNNSQLISLEFVRDVIQHSINTTDLIDDVIHRTHPIRSLPGEELYSHMPNDYPKTWKTLKRILIEGKMKAPETLVPSDVIFIDDMIHNDLIFTLPRKNYITAPPYTYVCPFEKIVLVYHDCLTEEGIFKNNSIYNEYLRAVSIRNPNIPSITTDEFSNYTFHNHMEYYYNESHINKIRGYQMPPRDEIKQKLGILLAKLKKRK